jgi:hypothetical protein
LIGNALIDVLFLKHGKICTGPFLPGSKGFNDKVKAPKRNLEKAKDLLTAAGYDSKHPLIFEIATSNSNAIRPYAAEILQRQTFGYRSQSDVTGNGVASFFKYGCRLHENLIRFCWDGHSP